MISAVGLGAIGAAQSASAGTGLPPTDMYVGGILHSPLGGVTLTQTDARKLRACCLGSTGKDGVEVHYNTVAGGSVVLDPGSLPFGSSMECGFKGWDGTVKGRCDIARTPTDDFGMAIDFSGVGCNALRVLVVDDDGTVLSDDTSAGDQRYINLNGLGVIGIGSCPGGGFPQWYAKWKFTEPPYWNGFQWVYIELVWVFGCPGSSYDNSRQVRIYPLFDAFPTTFGLESMVITGTGGAPLDVADASILFHDVHSFGVGGSHVHEACDNPAGCTATDVSLLCDNLGSSGQDGVAFDIRSTASASPGGGSGGGGGGSGGIAMEIRPCCRGHVIIMKLYDEEGDAQSVSRSPLPGGGPDDQELDADFSSIGAVGYVLELFDANNDPIGPPGGTEIIGGGPRPWFTNRCPEGSIERWINVGTSNNPVWEFVGCDGGSPSWNFTLPGGILVPDVASYRVTPLGAVSSFSSLTRCELLRDGGAIQVSSITLTPAACPGDANDDRVVNFDDITAALASWASDYSPLTGSGDANHDSVVNFDDITEVLANWGSTCP